MPTCPIQSKERLRALLRHEISEPEATELLTHLQTDCERCLELYATLDEDVLLADSADAQIMLSSAEADAMYAAVNPEPRLGWFEKLLRSPFLIPLAATSALLLIALFFVLRSPAPGPRPDRQHVKAVGKHAPLPVKLMGIIGQSRQGQALAVQRAAAEDPLRPGQVLMLRYRIDRPAWIYLLAGPPGQRELIHSETGMETAGEHEVQAAGQALAIPAEKLGRGLEITVLACPEDLSLSKGPLDEQVFANCGRDSLVFSFRAGAR